MDLAKPAQKLLVEQTEKKGGEKKEKKPRTEKQLLADEKRRQNILAKKAAFLEEKSKEVEQAEKLIQLEELKKEKKRLAAEKRKAKKLEKKGDGELLTMKEIVAPLLESIEKKVVKKRKGKQVELEEAVDEAVDSLSLDDTIVEKEKVVKKRRVQKNSDEPPAWFQKYIQGVKGEINTVAEKPKELVQIEKESVKEAKKAWNNGLTRARVNNEVEGHMDRMYEMMFGNKLK